MAAVLLLVVFAQASMLETGLCVPILEEANSGMKNVGQEPPNDVSAFGVFELIQVVSLVVKLQTEEGQQATKGMKMANTSVDWSHDQPMSNASADWSHDQPGANMSVDWSHDQPGANMSVDWSHDQPGANMSVDWSHDQPMANASADWSHDQPGVNMSVDWRLDAMSDDRMDDGDMADDVSVMVQSL